MKRGLVLSLFDLTGNMVRPWAEAGFDTLCVDIEHSIRSPVPGTVRCDLRTLGPLLVILAQRGYTPKDLAFLACFPPCTDVSVSGTRDHPTKGLRALAGAVEMFATCRELAELTGAPWMVENPVSTMATYWRKPDHYFHPWQYAKLEPADHYTKKTSIWCGNGFVMPPPSPLKDAGPPDDRIFKASPGSGRAHFRSATPMGFAHAVFVTNGPRQVEAAE